MSFMEVVTNAVQGNWGGAAMTIGGMMLKDQFGNKTDEVNNASFIQKGQNITQTYLNAAIAEKGNYYRTGGVYDAPIKTYRPNARQSMASKPYFQRMSQVTNENRYFSSYMALAKGIGKNIKNIENDPDFNDKEVNAGAKSATLKVG